MSEQTTSEHEPNAKSEVTLDPHADADADATQDGAGAREDGPDDSASPPAAPPQEATTVTSYLWKEWVRPIIVIILLVSAFKSAVAELNRVPTSSMEPTIQVGDRILVNKLAYDLKLPYTTWRLASWSGPSRGDIVILLSPDDGTRLVKRVVALPGDVIELRSNRLYINDVPADYEFAANAGDGNVIWFERFDDQEEHEVMTAGFSILGDQYGPLTLDDDEYFVMGDNRDHSRDSRVFGTVSRPLILGRTGRVAWSWDGERNTPRWGRFGAPLP